MAAISAVGVGPALPSAAADDRPTPADHALAEPVELPAPAAVGQAALTETAIQTTIGGGPVSLVFTMSSAVTDVNNDGSYVARSVIDSVAVTNAPASADVSAWGFDRLQGVSFDQRYASTGTPIASQSGVVDAQSMLRDSVGIASVGFPTEPVTIGDSWQVEGRIRSQSLVVPVTYQCRLVSVVDHTYVLDVSYAQNFSAAVADGVAEGTISGTGTLSGSLANPLVVSGGLNQTIDGVAIIDGMATPMRRDTSVTITATGG